MLIHLPKWAVKYLVLLLVGVPVVQCLVSRNAPLSGNLVLHNVAALLPNWLAEPLPGTPHQLPRLVALTAGTV